MSEEKNHIKSTGASDKQNSKEALSTQKSQASENYMLDTTYAKTEAHKITRQPRMSSHEALKGALHNNKDDSDSDISEHARADSTEHSSLGERTEEQTRKAESGHSGSSKRRFLLQKKLAAKGAELLLLNISPVLAYGLKYILKNKNKRKLLIRILVIVILIVFVFSILVSVIQAMILSFLFAGIAGEWTSLTYDKRYKTSVQDTSCVCGCLTESTPESVGTASLLPGESNAEKIWNYFVSANISGVSDNPSVISGILGNLKQESGLNPFAFGVRDGVEYGGLYQTLEDEFMAAMSAAGLDDYWGQDSDVPQEAIDEAIRIELDYLVNEQDGMRTFLERLDKVSYSTGEDGARSYAELFMVMVERAVTSNDIADNQLTDPVVKEAANAWYGEGSEWQNSAYQEMKIRRDNATAFYNEFATMSPSAVTNTVSAFSSSTDITFIGDSLGEALTGTATSGDPSTVDPASALASKVGDGSYLMAFGGEHTDWGLEILEAIKGTNDLKDYVVIELGTNPSGYDIPNLELMLQELADKKVVLVAPFMGKSADFTSSTYDLDAMYPTVDATAEWMRTTASSNPNINVADWNNHAKGDLSLLEPDGIHVGATSAEVLANLIVEALGKFKEEGEQSVTSTVECECLSSCSCWEYHGEAEINKPNIGNYGFLENPYRMWVSTNELAGDGSELSEAQFYALFANQDQDTGTVICDFGGRDYPFHFGYIDMPFAYGNPLSDVSKTTSAIYPRYMSGSVKYYGMHTGWDLAQPFDTPIFAFADGVVTTIEGNISDTSGYGCQIVIAHEGGFQTRYAHMNGHLSTLADGSELTIGAVVKKGDKIGVVGSSGKSTGPHLHFEIMQTIGDITRYLIPLYYLNGTSFDNDTAGTWNGCVVDGRYVPPFADANDTGGYLTINPWD